MELSKDARQTAVASGIRDTVPFREPGADFATRIRTMIAETTRNPGDAIHIPAWDEIRGFDLPQVKEALRIAGDPLEEGLENTVACMLLSRWAELEPEAALASLVGGKSGNSQDILLAGALGVWMEKDPDAAYRWAKDHPENYNSFRPDFMRATAMLAEPPEVALEKSMRMPASVRLELVSILARSMNQSAEERERCFVMLAEMGEAERERAAQAMVASSRGGSAVASLEMMETLPMSPETLERERGKSLDAFSRREPAEAVAWLDAHPEIGSAKERGVAFHRWNERDETAAAAWLDRQENPASVLAAAVTGVNLEILADRFGQSWRSRQGGRLRDYYERWQKLDPAAAERWLGEAAPDIVNFVTTEADEREK